MFLMDNYPRRGSLFLWVGDLSGLLRPPSAGIFGYLVLGLPVVHASISKAGTFLAQLSRLRPSLSPAEEISTLLFLEAEHKEAIECLHSSNMGPLRSSKSGAAAEGGRETKKSLFSGPLVMRARRRKSSEYPQQL